MVDDYYPFANEKEEQDSNNQHSNHKVQRHSDAKLMIDEANQL